MNGLSGKAAIAGIGATEFSKNSGRSELRLAVEAALAALADAGETVHVPPVPGDEKNDPGHEEQGAAEEQNMPPVQAPGRRVGPEAAKGQGLVPGGSGQYPLLAQTGAGCA